MFSSDSTAEPLGRRAFLGALALAGGASAQGPSLRILSTGIVYDRGPGLIAGACRAKNGDLLVSFNSGGDLSAGQKSGIVRSSDGGKSWSAPEHFFESVFKRGGIEAGCTLTCLKSGRLLLPYADGFYLFPGAKNENRNALLFCPFSDDHGRTWQGTKAQAYEGFEAFAFGRVVELANGTLLLPLWGAYDRRGIWGAGILKSKDQGETWSEWRSIVRERGDETPILLLPDGRVLALIRGYSPAPERPFHVAWSSDGGDTWTPPKRVSINGTSPSLHVTPRGLVLAGFRSTLSGGRCHVASSRDGGNTWTHELELKLPKGDWKSGGYPVFTTLADGKILATFHNRDPGWYVAHNVLAEM